MKIGGDVSLSSSDESDRDSPKTVTEGKSALQQRRLLLAKEFENGANMFLSELITSRKQLSKTI
jgi:hypothetical protein